MAITHDQMLEFLHRLEHSSCLGHWILNLFDARHDIRFGNHLDKSDDLAAILRLLLHLLLDERPKCPFSSDKMFPSAHHRRAHRHRWSADHSAGRPARRRTSVKSSQRCFPRSMTMFTYVLIRFRQVADLSFQRHEYDLEITIHWSLCHIPRRWTINAIDTLSLFCFFLCSHATSFGK